MWPWWARRRRRAPPRFRTRILVATFASLHFGEVTALQRADVDVAGGTVQVRQAFSEVRGRRLVLDPPKSNAGVRTVAILRLLAELLDDHWPSTSDPSPRRSCSRPDGAPIRRGNFNKLVRRKESVASVGRPGLHFHDLRHTGNMLAARSQITTRDLTARMGHDSMQAALMYQHATAEAGHRIAEALDAS